MANPGKFLSGHDLFQAFTAQEIELVNRISSVKSFQANETVYEHDGAVSHVFLVIEGTVALRLPAKPPEISLTISKVGSGELFGIAPLLGAERYTATAVAETAAEIMTMEVRPLRELLRANTVAAASFMTRVAQAYFGRYVELMKSFQAAASRRQPRPRIVPTSGGL